MIGPRLSVDLVLLSRLVKTIFCCCSSRKAAEAVTGLGRPTDRFLYSSVYDDRCPPIICQPIFVRIFAHHVIRMCYGYGTDGVFALPWKPCSEPNLRVVMLQMTSVTAHQHKQSFLHCNSVLFRGICLKLCASLPERNDDTYDTYLRNEFIVFFFEAADAICNTFLLNVRCKQFYDNSDSVSCGLEQCHVTYQTQMSSDTHQYL